MLVNDSVPDWRRLFDTIRVPWVDRGKNVGRDRVNIHCPWCGPNDPSEHLSISTIQPTYVCQRVTHHKGGRRPGLLKLLRALGVSNDEEANGLLDKNISQGPVTPTSYGKELDAVMKEWAKFRPASESNYVLDYLYYRRGFPQPDVTCERYNLRYAPIGAWATRILFPLSYDGATVLSWTGRTLTDKTPKYLNQDVQDMNGLLYIGRRPRRIAIIVEGPFDALKINVACEQLPVSAIALTGMTFSMNRIVHLRNYLVSSDIRLISLDSSVPYPEISALRGALDFGGGGLYSRPLEVPPSYKDPGDMPLEVIVEWITKYLNTGDNNGADMHSNKKN